MHRERRDSEQPRQNRVPVEDAGMRADLEIGPKRFKKIPFLIERHAANDVAHCRAEEDREQYAGKGKQEIKERPPERILHVGPKFDTDAAQHQEPQNDHQRQVKTTEARGVKGRKSKKQSAGRSQKPHLISIPDGADSAQDQTALVVRARDKEADDTSAEIEAV